MNRKLAKIFAMTLASLTVISASGCAISAALEEENGFKYSSTQVSAEEQLPDVTYHQMSASSLFKNAAPSIFSDYTEKPYGLVEGDIYVSQSGNDETGDGSKANPYKTIEKARDVVRAMKADGKLPEGGLTVAIMAGEYRLSSSIEFTSEDSGTAECPITYAAYGDGEVVFKGSVSLSAADFLPIGDDIKAILPDDAKNNVVMIDLKKYGVTADDLVFKDRDNGDPNVILSINRETYTIARYPNGDESVQASGSNSDGSFKLSGVVTNRIKSWHTTDGVWVAGLFWTDYEVDHGLLNFNSDNGSFTVDGVQMNRNDAHMFFYNILDELDVPGEYYIDRDNCLLYVYPDADLASAEIEFAYQSFGYAINAEGISNMTFKGFNFVGIKSTCVVMSDIDNVHLTLCKFYSSANAADLWGYNSSIVECESHYMEMNGLSIGGGEKATLKRGNNLLENCYSTHAALANITGDQLLALGGYGNTLRHCEAAYSTGCSIAPGFGLNVLEYNLIHDTTTWATDMGSIYTGSSVACINQEYRYNIWYNIGYPGRGECSTMFWDDGHCSQRSYGNLIVNVAGYGQTIGGGHNHSYINNTIVNTGNSAIYYDQRPFNGYHIYGGDTNPGAFYSLSTNGYMWNLYQGTPYMTQVWLENAPWLSQVLQDDSDTKAAHFLYAPALSLFSDNIIVSGKAPDIHDATRNYSIFQDNYIDSMVALESVFVDPANGDYRIKEDSVVWDTVNEFVQTPYQLVGRY